MNLEKYPYETISFKDFEFYSTGPKGKIKKVVRFSERLVGSILFYNLGFGDWNESDQKIDDFVVSGNEDREKILATIASAVLDFTDIYKFPIVAKGSCPARTRLYQMGINKHYNDIASLFELFGLIESHGWQRFQKGVNYDAFLVVRK